MATSNLSSNAIRILTLPAAVIGIVQGAVWLGLSLTAILVYNEVIEITNPTVYEDLICNIYLRYNMIFIDIFLVNSKVFNIIMYFYLVLSFIWLIISAYMLWAVVRRKWNYTIHVLICWSTVTILLSLIDISFMSVLAADLQKAQDIFASAMIPTTPTITAITPDVPSAVYSFDVPIEPVDLLDENVPIGPIQQFANLLVTTTPHAILKNRIITATKQDVYTAIGIVMSIAARGYILWIVNVIFAVILVVQVLKFRSNMSLSWMERPIINAYGNGQKPFSLYDNVPIDKSFQNEGFVSDVLTGPSDNLQNNNRNPLSNSNRSSLVYGQTPTYPLDYNKPTIIIPSAQSDGKLAKIGRAGGTRSPPRNVPSPTVPHSSNMPYIPEPDYTPPGSPKPKGVLRPGSKYEY